MKGILLLICLVMTYVASCAPGYANRRGWMFRDHSRIKIVQTAKHYLGVRYRFGGTTPYGFDCSGFVRFVYRKNGIVLPHGASEQYFLGKRIHLRTARPGDLVFFRTRRKRISHVGIYLGNYRFIHSPSKGKEVTITDMNMIYWRQRYIGAVTLFAPRDDSREYTFN